MGCICDKYEKSRKENLILITEDPDTWDILFKCQTCGSFWEEYYPLGERHGSGPRAMRKVSKEYADDKYKSHG